VASVAAAWPASAPNCGQVPATSRDFGDRSVAVGLSSSPVGAVVVSSVSVRLVAVPPVPVSSVARAGRVAVATAGEGEQGRRRDSAEGATSGPGVGHGFSTRRSGVADKCFPWCESRLSPSGRVPADFERAGTSVIPGIVPRTQSEHLKVAQPPLTLLCLSRSRRWTRCSSTSGGRLPGGRPAGRRPRVPRRARMQTNRCRAPSPATADQDGSSEGILARTSSSNWPAERSVSTSPSRPHLRVARRFARCWRGTELECTVVRTCRFCASSGDYSPITANTAIDADGESICPDCAKAELDRELAFSGGITSDARDRLEDLLLEVQGPRTYLEPPEGEPRPGPDEVRRDLGDDGRRRPRPRRLAGPASGYPATPGGALRAPATVQSLAVEHGATDGEDQLVVSATATGRPSSARWPGWTGCSTAKGRCSSSCRWSPSRTRSTRSSRSATATWST